MSVVGERATIVKSTDKTLEGRSGEIVLETANMLRFRSGDAQFGVQKKGTALLLKGNGELVDGSDISGRLEDRLGARNK